MSLTKANPLRYLVFKLIKDDIFQEKLNVISEFNIPHFEKWFQIELACFFKKNHCNHFSRFEWYNESAHKKGSIIPDFIINFIDEKKVVYTEIKQYDSFITCIRYMINDFNKVKNVIGIHNCENINCIGIFKKDTYSDCKLSKIKEEFKRHKYLSNKLNKLKIKEIENTAYSLIYF